MKISILVAVKNESLHVKEALDSVLMSSLSCFDIEIIVVDDNSQDDTYEIVEKISYNNHKIIVMKSDGNGKVAAFNLAYLNATGDYFVLFAGDDLLVSEVIESRVSCLVGLRDPCVSLCKLQMFSTEKKYDGIVIPKSKLKGAKTGGAMAFNKTFADLIFPVPEKLPNEDCWIKAFIEYYTCKVFHVPVVGLKYRIHSSNSLKRDVPFASYSTQLSKRNYAFELFLDRHGRDISSGAKMRLVAFCTAEKLRQKGHFIQILLLKNLDFKSKFSLSAYSNSFLYCIRGFFYSLLSGR